MTGRPAYLDNNATTPMDPSVFEAMRPWFLEWFGNASSATHSYGWQAKEAVEEARAETALLVGAAVGDVVFTGGATEALNLAILGAASARRGGGGHVVTCVTEHAAVLDCCARLESEGVEVTRLAVDRAGMVDLQRLRDSIREETFLVALMHANNETGVLHPVAEIGGVAREMGVLFCCDATQAVGRVVVDMAASGIDLLAFSAHKLHGPKGVGALCISRRARARGLRPLIVGGGQERGFRSGTLNVPGIVGMGAACSIARGELTRKDDRVLRLRDRLEAALLSIPGASLNGHGAPRLPNTCNIRFDTDDGARLPLQVSSRIAVSSGSACSSVEQRPSHVLLAMGLAARSAMASLRFSLGRFNREEDVDIAAAAMRGVICR